VTWAYGEAIVCREVLNDGRPWLAKTVYVVEDTAEQLVTYLPGGTALGFLEGDFPTPTGRHPWNRAEINRWQGHGVLMVQKPGDDHAVWHFWDGPDREFECWYVNLQEAFRRTPIGYDTQDLELDIVVPPDGSWKFKDQELLAEHVQRGRYTTEQVERVVELGDRLGAELDAGRRWWDEHWSTWTPDVSWGPVDLPPDWQRVPTRA
jgi:hypothetical protein